MAETKTYHNARMEDENLHFGDCGGVTVSLTRPLKHGTITVTSEFGIPPGGLMGYKVIRIVQDDEVIFEED